MLISRE